MKIQTQPQKLNVKSPTALYQQLFTPNGGGPSPYLLRLDSLAKKFSKFSKSMLLINLTIGFLLIFLIALKIYYISEYWVHSCDKLVLYYTFTLISCILWFISSYIAIFGIERKNAILIKLHILILFLACLGFGSAILFWELFYENCKLHYFMNFSIIMSGVEIGVLTILIGLSFYLYKLMKVVKSTRDQYEREGLSFLK